MSEKTTPVVNMTDDDFLGSLTGFDELAIMKRFDAPIAQLVANPTTYLRALIFINMIRLAGKNPGDAEAEKLAKQQCMGLSINQCMAYFADEPAESDGEQPAGEAPPAATPDPQTGAPEVIEIGSHAAPPSPSEPSSSLTSV